MINLRPNQITKQKIVQEIEALINNHQIFLFVEYKGLKVVDFQIWKKKLNTLFADPTTPVLIKVYKNSLLKRALNKTKYKKINDCIAKMMFVIASNVDGLLLIKVFANFIKKNKDINFLAGIYNHEVLFGKEINILSLLPTRQELLLQIIFALKSVPLNLVLTLNKISQNKNKLEKIDQVDKNIIK